MDCASTSPAGSGWRAWAPVAYQAVPVCVPFSYAEKVKVNAMSGLQVAVGVDVDPVDRVGVEFRARHRRGYRGRGARRVRVDDQRRHGRLVTVKWRAVMFGVV
jgi:hypothetical protein